MPALGEGRTTGLADPRLPLRAAKVALASDPNAPLLLGAVLGAGLLAVLARIAAAVLLAEAVAATFLRRATLPALAPSLLTLGAALLLQALATWARGVFEARLAGLVEEALTRRLVAALLRLGGGWAEEEVAARLPVLRRAVVQVALLATTYLPLAVFAMAEPFLVALTVGLLFWPALVVLALTFPLIPFFMVLVGKASESLSERQWRSLEELTRRFLDVLEGSETLALFGRAAESLRRLAHLSESYRAAVMRTLRVAMLSALVLELFASLATAVVAVVVALALVPGRLPFWAALAVLLLTPLFYQPQRELGGAFHRALEGLSASASLFPLLSKAEQAEVAEAGPRRKAGNTPPTLEFWDVGVRFPEREWLFRALSFAVPAGTVLAVVGPSGAGKSTLLRLILGTLRPDAGEIRVDGVPLSHLEPASWLERLAYVAQEPHFLPGSIRENLLVASPRASEARLWEALHLADLDRFVAELPEGLDHPVGVGARLLSSGQRQRLALARALLADRPLLLLDEPTSHLDPITRARVLSRLGPALSGRTVVLVTHLPEEAALASATLVLAEGCTRKEVAL